MAALGRLEGALELRAAMVEKVLRTDKAFCADMYGESSCGYRRIRALPITQLESNLWGRLRVAAELTLLSETDIFSTHTGTAASERVMECMHARHDP